MVMMLERLQAAPGLRRSCKPKCDLGTNSSDEKGVGSLSNKATTIQARSENRPTCPLPSQSCFPCLSEPCEQLLPALMPLGLLACMNAR